MDFFNLSVSNQISLIAISVDNSDVLHGSKGRGNWPLIIIVNNSINKITSEEGTRNFPLWLSNNVT